MSSRLPRCLKPHTRRRSASALKPGGAAQRFDTWRGSTRPLDRVSSQSMPHSTVSTISMKTACSTCSRPVSHQHWGRWMGTRPAASLAPGLAGHVWLRPASRYIGWAHRSGLRARDSGCWGAGSQRPVLCTRRRTPTRVVEPILANARRAGGPAAVPTRLLVGVRGVTFTEARAVMWRDGHQGQVRTKMDMRGRRPVARRLFSGHPAHT